MINIEISKEDFEYDIRSLVRAFYPGKEIKTGAIGEFKEEGIRMQIFYEPETIRFLCFKDKTCLFHLQTKALLEETRKIFPDEKEEPERKPAGRWKYNAIIKERKSFKNRLKRLIYEGLSAETKIELPWGTLTGIRPTKIPMDLLANGTGRQDITAYMQKEYLCSKEKSKLCTAIAEKEYDMLKNCRYEEGYSIYIGIPFCPTTCLYCSFTSYSIDAYQDKVESYLAALFKEIDFAASCYPDKKLKTVYIGGGTPTTLTENQLERLLIKIQNTLPMESVLEFTVEAGRPDSITAEKLKILKENKVTRISINPQTMNQETLDIIGRKHTIAQTKEAFDKARKAGHTNINMDLIIGLPGETMKEAVHTMEEILDLQPDSLTIHTLAIKRAARLNTFWGEYADMLPENAEEIFEYTKEETMKAGYRPYYLYRQKNMADNLENIGYAKPLKEGLYNILIMEEKHTILALGAGASSKFVLLDGKRIERCENVKSVTEYIERIDEMIARKQEWTERN